MDAYVFGLHVGLATVPHIWLPASIGVTGFGMMTDLNILILAIVPIVFFLVIGFGKLTKRI